MPPGAARGLPGNPLPRRHSVPDPAPDTATAQRARLGYASPRLTRRSLGLLAANLTLQVWQRAHALHLAAQARNGDGALRFLSPDFAHARRDTVLAAAAGGLLIAAARLAA